jgi:uncharacterized protein YndB with AHSA1/START domain
MSNTVKAMTPSDREILIERTFDAPRILVFDCMSKPELVKRWLLGPPGWTMPVCEIDFRVGGRCRYVWRRDNGTEMAMNGVYREIVRPERIVHTELFDEDWTGGETVATSVLTQQGARTTLSITILYASKEARDGALRSGMTEGMTISYDKLDELMASLPAE